MCGILLSYSINDDSVLDKHTWDALVDEVNCRGPDFNKTTTVVGSLVDNKAELKLHSSVLSMRKPFHEQPYIDPERGDRFLQYNGEIYNNDVEFKNDTEYVMDQFKTHGVMSAVQRFRGEYAFTYVEHANDPVRRCIWFGRDCIGRRSLLYCKDDSNLIISSVPPADRRQSTSLDWQEVPGGSLFKIDLATMKVTEFPWTHSEEGGPETLVYPYASVASDIDPTEESTTAQLTDELSDILQVSVQKRVENIPQINVANEPQVAILFSGGLDCTLLALMVDKVLPSNAKVDLLNVAFENPRSGNGYQTPDRLLGRSSWKELSEICTKDRFRFVEINVSYTETLVNRDRVQGLMYPKNTVMDLSIALAFYFASRGQGDLYSSLHDTEPEIISYESPARVLISGLGADELFGGYTRHTNQLRRNGYHDLSKELQLDFDRLHERNLGRDDRVCACWGKELRYPFLDEHLVRWALKLPLRLKVYRDDEKPSEEFMQTKFILRELARVNKLLSVSQEKKRAIQFGAKSAKMEVGQSKVKGQDLLT